MTDLHGSVTAFRSRPLDHNAYPSVFVDATFRKARVGSDVVFSVIVIAVDVGADGRREVAGFDVGKTESVPLWTDVFGSLKARSLSRVHSVVSDTHSGLVSAIALAFHGERLQRCLEHFMRTVFAKAAKVAGPLVAATINTIVVARRKTDLVHAHVKEVLAMSARSHPAVADMLDEAREGLLALSTFPSAHW